MSSNFERLHEIKNQAYVENFNSLAWKMRKRVTFRHPYLRILFPFVFTLYAYIYEMHRKEAFNNCVDIVLPSFDNPWKYLNVNIFYPNTLHCPRFEGPQTHHKERKKYTFLWKNGNIIVLNNQSFSFAFFQVLCKSKWSYYESTIQIWKTRKICIIIWEKIRLAIINCN